MNRSLMRSALVCTLFLSLYSCNNSETVNQAVESNKSVIDNDSQRDWLIRSEDEALALLLGNNLSDQQRGMQYLLLITKLKDKTLLTIIEESSRDEKNSEINPILLKNGEQVSRLIIDKLGVLDKEVAHHLLSKIGDKAVVATMVGLTTQKEEREFVLNTLDELTGKLRFSEKEDPACGAALYFEKRDVACGAEKYLEKRSEACGVELYNERTSGEICGYDIGKEWRERDSDHPGKGPSGWYVEVKVAKSCRHPSFGVERYNLCRAESHGVELYATCRLPQFGVEKYNSCAFYKDDFDVKNSLTQLEFSIPHTALIQVSHYANVLKELAASPSIACLIKRYETDRTYADLISELKSLYAQVAVGEDYKDVNCESEEDFVVDMNTIERTDSLAIIMNKRAYQKSKEQMIANAKEIALITLDLERRRERSFDDGLENLVGLLEGTFEN